MTYEMFAILWRECVIWLRLRAMTSNGPLQPKFLLLPTIMPSGHESYQPVFDKFRATIQDKILAVAYKNLACEILELNASTELPKCEQIYENIWLTSEEQNSFRFWVIGEYNG